jgi:hypothetical protein
MTETNTKIPAPVYAVAGAGDVALRQLRKLPAVTAELRAEIPARAVELGVALPARAAELRAQVATQVPAAVQSLMAEAQQVYLELVARGERVVARGRSVAAEAVDAPAPTTRPATAQPRTTKVDADTPAKVRTRRAPATTAAARKAPARPAKATRATKATKTTKRAR